MRPVSTDLNFTFALAVVAVVMIQVMGFRAQGIALPVEVLERGRVVQQADFRVH